MLLQKTKENRYRHYKGGIYYKIAEGIIGDNYSEIDKNVSVIGIATYEPTGESMLILSSKNGYTFTFDGRVIEDIEEIDTIYLEDAILYESEEGGLRWIRLKDEWEGFTEVKGEKIKRFTLANT